MNVHVLSLYRLCFAYVHLLVHMDSTGLLYYYYVFTVYLPIQTIIQLVAFNSTIKCMIFDGLIFLLFVDGTQIQPHKILSYYIIYFANVNSLYI